jgi:hypothetical protein
VYQPPKKKITVWIDEITRWEYSTRNIISNIVPLYSVAYPATTSASVSAWSKGVRFDSRRNKIIKLEAMGINKIINQ